VINNKLKYILLFNTIISSIFCEEKKGGSKKSSFFDLVKFDTSSPYETGYWYDKWFKSREFSYPVKKIPIELRYGIGFNGSFSGSASDPSAKDEKTLITYEDNSIEKINQDFSNLWGTAIDIDFMMYNLPHYILNTSWLNMMTGFSYRKNTLSNPATIPFSVWGNIEGKESWGVDKKFSPTTNEFLITNVMQWQPFNSWYLNFRYGYGFANTKFYTSDNKKWDETPSGSGTSMALGFGIRFILDPGKANKFSLGIDLRHSYTKIHTINDPKNVTPIEKFRLTNYGLYLTLSAFYGGDLSKGDKAKRLYFSKDYIGARNEFRTFLNEYPTHSNHRSAKEYLEICEYKIPYVIMEQGVVLDSRGKTEKALEKYLYAKSLVKKDTIIMGALDGRIDQIALIWMNEAEMLLTEEKYNNALSLVKRVSKFSNHGENALRRFKSYTILGSGKEYQGAGFIGKAMSKYTEALKMNPELIYMVKALQYNAGIQMVGLAGEADEFDEIYLAIESLTYAKELSGGIGEKNETLLEDLKKKLDNYDEYQIRKNIDKRMSLAREEKIISKSESISIGMKLLKVQELLGDPHEKVEKNIKGINDQLWIYFVNNKSLHLSFQNYILYKIEEI
tara:strand:+ start:1042 stop:2895 length:1854 start_codon:yes stop_codon:yes gene_type:complete